MLNRRGFLGYSALAPTLLAGRWLHSSAAAEEPSRPSKSPLRLAIIGNTYHYGSDLQTIADRFLVGYPYAGDWHIPNVQVVSMYVEPKPRLGHVRTGGQRAQNLRRAAAPSPLTEDGSGPLADLSERRAQEFGFRLCPNIPAALRSNGDRIAVDAVLAVVEQGDYPRNDTGQILYPRYDFFQQCAQVFEEEGRALPYFNSGSLSFSFREAETMVATSERLKFSLLAGSSLPVTWRLPDIDIPLGARLEEAVMVGEGDFDGLDFDALEALQSMLERRQGGETGVKAVQLLEGDEVWAAGDSGRWSKELLSSALSRSDAPLGLTVIDGRPQDMVASGVLPQLAKNPAAYCLEYIDGTRATLLLLNGADQDFTFSARVTGHGLIATQFFRSLPPYVNYSAGLTAKIEQMFTTGIAPYPVLRTLLTSGILEACLTSKARLHQRIETPHLAVRYQPPAESQYART
jgi:hypothetical protein